MRKDERVIHGEEQLRAMLEGFVNNLDMVFSCIEGWMRVERICVTLVLQSERCAAVRIEPEEWPAGSYLMCRLVRLGGFWLPSFLLVEAPYLLLGGGFYLRAAVRFVPLPEEDGGYRLCPEPIAPTVAYRRGMEEVSWALGIPHEPSFP